MARTRLETTNFAVQQVEDSAGITLMVEIALWGTKYRAVVDTGAQISMVSSRVMNEFPSDVCAKGPPIRIKNAENHSYMDCFLVPNLEFHLGQGTYTHTMAAGPITDDFILGLDFWLLHNGTINLPKHQIEMEGWIIPIIMVKLGGGEWHPVSQVSVTDYCVIPPQSEMIVPVTTVGSDRTYVTSSILDKKLLGPPCIIEGGITAGILVVNDSSEQVILKPGTTITTATELADTIHVTTDVMKLRQMTMVDADERKETNESNTNLSAEDWERKVKNMHLPGHVQQLFDSSRHNLDMKQQFILGELLVQYADTFAESDEDLGKFDLVTHAIPTVDENPVQERQRRTPLKFVKEEEEVLKKMLDGGIIQPSASAWASAPVLVRKKDGSVRYAIDYRKLNSKTVKDAYPLPLISECIDALQGNNWFHALDLAAGYWQIVLDPKDAHKSAFITRHGLFEYTRMPFGLCNAPATFQRVMHLVLRGMVWKKLLVYLDDVVILGSSFEEAVSNLKQTLDRFKQHNLKLKPKKCQLFQREVKFLGRKINKDGLQVSDEHSQCIREWPTPRNAEELQRFLGFINYHRAFIPKLAEKAEPLFALTKKNRAFVWSPECETSFHCLKEELQSPPVLSLPTESDPFILDTDASDFAVAGCLYQVRDGKEYPISFSSQTLTPAQRKYCTTRKELLAIVVFTRQFRHYLLGNRFLVRTDHGSLAWLYRFKEPMGQLGRWLEELSQYDMVIQHRPGVQHVNADALSRMPTKDQLCNCYEAGKEVQGLPCGGCAYCHKLHNQWERFQSEVDYVVPLAVRQLNTTAACDDGLQLHGYSCEEIQVKQIEDPELQPIIAWMKDTGPSEGELLLQGRETKSLWRHRQQLCFIEGVLYYNWVESYGNTIPRLVVPEALRTEILELAHDGALGGHWGRDKTSSRIRKLFFWPGMEQDVALFVATCSMCSRNKNKPKGRAPLTSYQAGLPNERVHLDFLGPFTTSQNGNRYVLSIVDQFTKWIEVYALPEQTAAATARTFFDGWISRFGVPRQVHTDQGRNFTSQLFTDLCKMLEATKTRTTPYRPSANGQVERYNQLILSYIRCQLEGEDCRWDEFLSPLGMSLRATINRNTGFTPNALQLGREIDLPLDIMFDLESKPTWSSSAEYVRELNAKLRQAFEKARDSLKEAQQRQKIHYDTRANIRTRLYNIGDLVYLVNSQCPTGKSAKLQPTLLGPFVVNNVISDYIYEIRGRRRVQVVHQDRMRLCEDRCVPLWISRIRQEILSGETLELEQDEEVGIWFESLWAENENVTSNGDSEEVSSPEEQYNPEAEEEEVAEPYTTTSGRVVKRPARFLD